MNSDYMVNWLREASTATDRDTLLLRCHEAADEIVRLRGLVADLLPFAQADAKLGASIKLSSEFSSESDSGGDLEFEDRQWHEESLLLLARVHAGEFDFAPEISYEEGLKAHRGGGVDETPDIHD